MKTPNAKDKVDRRGRKSTGLGVVVHHVSVPDAGSRIDRAISILMVAAEEYTKLSREITNPEEDPPRQTYAHGVGKNEGGAAEEEGVKKDRHD